MRKHCVEYGMRLQQFVHTVCVMFHNLCFLTWSGITPWRMLCWERISFISTTISSSLSFHFQFCLELFYVFYAHYLNVPFTLSSLGVGLYTVCLINCSFCKSNVKSRCILSTYCRHIKAHFVLHMLSYSHLILHLYSS